MSQCGRRRRGRRSCRCRSASGESYPGFLVSEAGSDAVEELLEVDLAAEGLEVGDHVEDGGVLALEAEALHGGLEFPGVDLASGLGVEEVEGLLELLDLILSQAGPLNLLLSSRLHSGLCSGRH